MKALEEARGWKTSEPDPEVDELYHELVDGLFDLETELNIAHRKNLHSGRGWKGSAKKGYAFKLASVDFRYSKRARFPV